MSKRARVNWKGYWPAAPTPFTQTGTLDLNACAGLLNLYVDQGVHGILINGSTGEWFSQTPDERMELLECAVQAVNGRVPVVVGVSSYTPRESAALAAHAEGAGADGVLATPPPYVYPSPDEIVEFYTEVCAATTLPMMLYNWPRGVGVDLCLDTIARLAEIDNVVAIKESTGNEVKAFQSLERFAPELRFFGGLFTKRGLAMMREFGGDGNIDGGGLGARLAVPFYEAYWEGDLDGARRAARHYESLVRTLLNQDYSGIYGSPIPQLKAAMRLLGQPGGWTRRPLLDLTAPTTIAELRKALERAGLLG